MGLMGEQRRIHTMPVRLHCHPIQQRVFAMPCEHRACVARPCSSRLKASTREVCYFCGCASGGADHMWRPCFRCHLGYKYKKTRGFQKTQTTKETILSFVTLRTALYEPFMLKIMTLKKGKDRATNSSFPCESLLTRQ